MVGRAGRYSQVEHPPRRRPPELLRTGSPSPKCRPAQRAQVARSRSRRQQRFTNRYGDMTNIIERRLRGLCATGWYCGVWCAMLFFSGCRWITILSPQQGFAVSSRHQANICPHSATKRQRTRRRMLCSRRYQRNRREREERGNEAACEKEQQSAGDAPRGNRKSPSLNHPPSAYRDRMVEGGEGAAAEGRKLRAARRRFVSSANARGPSQPQLCVAAAKVCSEEVAGRARGRQQWGAILRHRRCWSRAQRG